MTKCICGKVLDEGRPETKVLRRPCRCGLPERKVTFGAPTIAIKPRNPERERLGLPDETPMEKVVNNPITWV